MCNKYQQKPVQQLLKNILILGTVPFFLSSFYLFLDMFQISWNWRFCLI